MKGYMSPMSTLAVLLPALLLPLLGLTANWSMNAIADIGTDFFHCGALHHAVHYLSPENLKGAVISIVIGMGLYFLFIRKFLMKDGRYVDRWPEKLDLENLLYRPLLLKWLPGVFGKISALFGENKLTAPLAKITLRISGILGRVFCDLPDALVLLLAKTVYHPTPESSDDKVYASMAYRLGKDIDILAIHQGKEQEGGRHYAHLVYRSLETIRKTTARITGNLSFALLMLCAAICVVFIYMILLYN